MHNLKTLSNAGQVSTLLLGKKEGNMKDAQGKLLWKICQKIKQEN